MFVLSKNRSSKEQITSFEIISGQEPVIRIPPIKIKECWIEIENGDNPPLNFVRITTGQAQRYLVAYLEKGKSYLLLAGNPNATLPAYELALFKDSIPQQLPVLQYGSFTTNVVVATGSPKFNWLWPTLIGVMAVLGFFTYQLTQDVKKETA